MDFVETACICALLIKRRKRQRQKRYWVHPLIKVVWVLFLLFPLYFNHRCIVYFQSPMHAFQSLMYVSYTFNHPRMHFNHWCMYRILSITDVCISISDACIVWFQSPMHAFTTLMHVSYTFNHRCMHFNHWCMYRIVFQTFVRIFL